MNTLISQQRFWLALTPEQASQDNSNDTLQPMCEFHVGIPLLWIKAYPGLS